MKQFSSFAFLIVFMLLSCVQEPLLSVDRTSLEYASTGGSLVLALSSNGIWRASSDQSWCVVSPNEGQKASNASITISCEPNVGYEIRNAIVTVQCGDEKITIQVSQAPCDIPESVAVSLVNDYLKNGFIVNFIDGKQKDGEDSLDSPIFYYVQEESVDEFYYHTSAVNAINDFYNEGVRIFYYKENHSWAIHLKDREIIFNEVADNTYNIAIIDEKGTNTYLYGVVIDVGSIEQDLLFINTKLTGEDWFHMISSACFKLGAFGIVALQAVALRNPLGVITTAFLEAWKSDLFGLRTQSGDLSLFVAGHIEDIKNIKQKNYIGALAGLLNDLADYELEQVGRIKEAVRPNLGDEWNIKISPPFIRCPNNDAQYTVHVSTKALWKVDDTNIDKRWCSVDKSGEYLIITIKEFNSPGVHSCSATIRQEDEFNSYQIDPVDFGIELYGDVNFSLYPSEVVFNSKGGSKPVMVKMSDNIHSWSIDKHPEWCTIERGDAKYSFWINVGPSDSGHEAEPIIVYGAVDQDTFFEAKVMVSQEHEIDPDEQLRQKLIKFYNDTGGPTMWRQRDNWCSDKPLDEWYGLYRTEEENWELYLQSNGLTGHGDLSGCTSIGIINCGGNDHLESLNVSGCTKLKYIYVSECLLSLNASGCKSLVAFDRSWLHGALKTLNLSDCSALEYLKVSSDLESLDISGCSSLKTAYIIGALYVKEYDFSNLMSLVDLSIVGNTIDCSIDVSGCSSMIYFWCPRCSAQSINLSGCSALKSMDCSDNQIKTLDISTCSSLESLVCSNNQLESIDISACSNLKNLSCGNNRIKQVITIEDRLEHFSYDKRYYYWHEWENGELKTKYSESTYGWWYPGEPEKGYHGR